MTSLRPSSIPGITLGQIGEQLHVEVPAQQAGVKVSGVELDSQKIVSGDLFAALSGSHHHGARFANDAVSAGAVAILTDVAGAQQVGDLNVPILICENPREALGTVAAAIYGSTDPSRMTFGITGTNGKTSITYALATVLERAGIVAALSTTAERRIGAQELRSDLTTPEAPELHSFLALSSELGAGAVALEVSAQALSRHRVSGVHFDVACFANLSHDHLDDYSSLDDYFAAKCLLFSPDVSSRGIVCIDDAWGMALAEGALIPIQTVTMDPDREADWHVDVTFESLRKTSFLVRGNGLVIESYVPVLGTFMALNAALAIIMALSAGIPAETIVKAVSGDSGIPVYIPGRLEVVSGPVGPHAVVDYGHTPEAFRVCLEALRRVTSGKIIMVFGADGDRDTLKRPDLGAIAARLSDVVIVTDYHPRSEEPAAIRSALLAGARAARPGGHILEQPNPARAVREAIAMARAGDVIFYAGPGHENFRDIAGKKVPYSAREDMRAALAEAGYPTGGLQ
jgi:UDP-N-acetylmuramoyl-L-alanyl-D-glutamate--2,6-diaminopimelate ligase